MIADYEYVNTRRVCFDGGATFVPVCETCGRYVKADAEILVNEELGLHPGPNATCKKCGPTRMLFEGFI